MKKIAILGACCSRDLYNTKFVPYWKEYADVVYYSFQTSFISIMASPIPYSREMMNFQGTNYSEWYRDILIREFEKSFCNDLISIKPDNILIDFYSDVVNGVWEVNGGETYLSRRLKEQNDNLALKNVYEKKALTFTDDYDKLMPLWKDGVKKFLSFLSEHLPNTRFIVNYPRFSNQILMTDGRIIDYGNKDVDWYNKLYSDMVDYIKELKEDVFVADLNKTYYINSDYIFGGAWIVHYQNEYYHDLIKLIDSLCINAEASKADNNINLIINSSGEIGTQFFKYFDDTFYISEENDEKHFEFLVNRNNSSYQQAWSHDIALDINSEYTIRFKCKVESDCPYKSNALLLVRTYDRQNKVLKTDSVDQYAVKWDGTYDTYSDYSITISPNGKFMSVGLYCDTSGHISWKDITVVRGDGTEPVEDNYIVKQLIKDKKLVDANRLPLYL